MDNDETDNDKILKTMIKNILQYYRDYHSHRDNLNEIADDILSDVKDDLKKMF